MTTKPEISDLPCIVDHRGAERQVLYTLPPAKNAERDSVLVFSLHKAGTLLLAKMTADLCNRVGLTWVSIHGELFQLGIPQKDWPPSASEVFLNKGYCYAGMPTFPEQFEIPIFGKVQAILLVRDPRDMLVSLYYSMRYSHPEPQKALTEDMAILPARADALKMQIDEFVLKMKQMYKINLAGYLRIIKSDTLRVFRYEDVIYEKVKLADSICDHFGWDIDSDVQREIVAKHDIIPRREEESQHVRQVHPGNFTKKLKLKTIRELEELFADEMAYFDYKPYKKSFFNQHQEFY